MTTHLTSSKPAAAPRGRGAALIAAIAIVVAAFAVIAVVRWQDSAGDTATPATAPIVLPRVSAAAASAGEVVQPAGQMTEATTVQQMDSNRAGVPAPVPDCMTVAHPITC